MTAEALAVALAGIWRNSRGVARCPAHDDRHPSLHIREKGGRVVFVCRAGCSQATVLAALRERGLWAPAPPDRPHAIDHARLLQAELGSLPLPEIPLCCLHGQWDGGKTCEHWRRFDLEYRLAHLRGELTEATQEIVELYDRAGYPLDAAELVQELRLAVDVRGVATAGFDAATIERAIKIFAEGWCGDESTRTTAAL